MPDRVSHEDTQNLYKAAKKKKKKKKKKKNAVAFITKATSVKQQTKLL